MLSMEEECVCVCVYVYVSGEIVVASMLKPFIETKTNLAHSSGFSSVFSGSGQSCPMSLLKQAHGC